MLGQSKTAFQAEIDAACELIDFWRFNPAYAQELYDEQPVATTSMWNQLDYRALEGFVYAVTPFNFTSIGGNLPTAPALMGNTVIWKPASSAMLSAYYLMKLLEAAGLPPGVINFVPGDAARSRRSCCRIAIWPACTSPAAPPSSTACGRPSARTFAATPRIRASSARRAARTSSSRTRPPILQALAVAIVRGGFEFQGQKCSAASRVYVPQSIWPEVRDRVVAMIEEIQMGDVRDFRNFMGAVIDEKRSTRSASTSTTRAQNAKILAGGETDGERGLLHRADARRDEAPATACCARRSSGRSSRPTSTTTRSGRRRSRWSTARRRTRSPAPCSRRTARAIREASTALRNAAGNFYVNDKPTGAVVGQQPFGGARASGTNDKAGSKLNLVAGSARGRSRKSSPRRTTTVSVHGG